MIDELLRALVESSSRILWRYSADEEDRREWEPLRDALEGIAPILSPEQRDCVLDAVNDFDNRLSVKMIGRP